MRFSVVCRTLVPALLLAAVASPGGASILENTTSGMVAYQFDADNHHDAPDTCAAASTAWSWNVGTATDGMLVPVEDPADFIAFDVPSSLVGSRLQVSAAEQLASQDVDLMVLAPQCDGTVFDLQNLPKPFPAPPTPGPGQAQRTLDNLDGSWTCNSSSWSFVINQLGGATPPASLYVAWTDGTQVVASLTSSNQGTAHYEVSQKTTIDLENVWANLPTSWTGNFRLGSGPCDTVDGNAVYGLPPVLGDDRIWFTPVRSGLHVARVTLAPPSVPSGPLAIPVSCHYCAAGIEPLAMTVSYRLAAVEVAA